MDLIARVNERRCYGVPLYGKDFQDSIKIFKGVKNASWTTSRLHCLNVLFNMNTDTTTDCLRGLLYNPERRIEELKDIFDRYVFIILILGYFLCKNS